MLSEMGAFLPPETTDLVSGIVRRNGRRARDLLRDLSAYAGTLQRREVIRGLRVTLPALGPSERVALLFGPEMRAWLGNTEEALALVRPGGSDLQLFDLVARGPYLEILLPHGRLDEAFRRRARRLGEDVLERAFKDLPTLLAFLTPRGVRLGPFEPDLREDGEEARLAGELHLAYPAPLTLRLSEGTQIELLGRPGPRRLPRAREDALPALEGAGAGLRLLDRGRSVECRVRDLVPGSGIVLTRRAVSSRGGLRPGPHVRGLGKRLGVALALLHAAWEEGFQEVIAHTRVVTPLEEKGTVSYSLIGRAGTSYINVWGKSVVDLTDDLLHEAAHHRLHGLEEIEGPLDRDDGEPRYFSPWRRSIRPLHGLLHATYTFSYRAELMRRLHLLARKPGGRVPRECGRLPRAWLRREMVREIGMLRRSLADLRDAENRGLLRAPGAALRRAMATRFRGLSRDLAGDRRRR
jgi:HEXXH motif-containing protein